MRPTPSKPAQNGFTLLEVMIALTITGLALGGLFGVMAGSKQLAWRSEAALRDVSQMRSLVNLAQLNDERGDVPLEFENDEIILSIGEELPAPERKTQASRFALRQYEVLDGEGEVINSGTYWVELSFPE